MIKPISYAEILEWPDLLAEYAAECSIPEIGAINPQREMYAAMENAGVAHCFGAFDGKMVGFACLLTTIYPHYGRRVATLESLFVGAKYRNGNAGGRLMDAVKDYAKEAGCTAIFYSAPTGGKLERLLSKLKGMRQTNSVFCQKL